MLITLPYPPSANRYYRRVGPRTLISKEGRTFRKNVCALLGGSGPRKPPYGGRIALAMDAFPPDRRARDLDNLQKATADALEHARSLRKRQPDRSIDNQASRSRTWRQVSGECNAVSSAYLSGMWTRLGFNKYGNELKCNYDHIKLRP